MCRGRRCISSSGPVETADAPVLHKPDPTRIVLISFTCYDAISLVLTSDFMPIFSPHQDAALKAVADWLQQQAGPRRPSGISPVRLCRHRQDHAARSTSREGVEGKVAFAAFTGKAALVMRAKGCDGASTIHSLIYRARESGEEIPSFDLWDEAPASKAKLIVIDECSMVDAELGRDLKSFGVPLLVLGDPAQLPPISGGGFFTDAEPDVMLTEVHRQARDNPIIRLSMDVREGKRLSPGESWRNANRYPRRRSIRSA